jgi:hypothetical protein
VQRVTIFVDLLREGTLQSCLQTLHNAHLQSCTWYRIIFEEAKPQLNALPAMFNMDRIF